MKRSSMVHGVAGAGVALLLAAVPAVAREGDPYLESTKTCQAVVARDIERVFPNPKNLRFDNRSLEERDLSIGVQITGKGTYLGRSDRERTFEFECDWNEDRKRVEKASWMSTYDSKWRDVTDTTYGSAASQASGVSQAEVTRVCRDAVDERVRKDFEHSIRKVELMRDTIERSESKGRHELEGQGRFLGGGGNWHRFDFTCTYSEDDDEVTEVTWKHLGDERDLD